MLNEGFIISVVIAILLGAAFVYLYYRLMYAEKKLGMMESILVDVRMTLDSLLLEDRQEGGAPAVPLSSAMLPAMPPSTVFTLPEPIEPSEAEPIPEEKFYSSVLEEAHEAAEEGAEGAESAEGNSQSIEQALESINSTGISGMAGAGASVANSQATNYDNLTRSELMALAEKRGVRVKRSASRNEVISVLRRTEAPQNDETTAGTENASEPAGSLFPSSGPMDSGFPVDLGQSEQVGGDSSSA
jgi:hypothetical protein